MIIDVGLAMLFVMSVAGAAWRPCLLRGAVLFLGTLLAATLATAWYERLAVLLERFLPKDFSDLAAVWILFLVLEALLAVTAMWATAAVPRFPRAVEWVGRGLFALLTAWTVVEFTALTLHTAPLRGDALPVPPARGMLFGMSPERRWVSWVRGSTVGGPFASPKNRFDPAGDFFDRYASRRRQAR